MPASPVKKEEALAQYAPMEPERDALASNMWHGWLKEDPKRQLTLDAAETELQAQNGPTQQTQRCLATLFLDYLWHIRKETSSLDTHKHYSMYLAHLGEVTQEFAKLKSQGLGHRNGGFTLDDLYELENAWDRKRSDKVETPTDTFYLEQFSRRLIGTVSSDDEKSARAPSAQSLPTSGITSTSKSTATSPREPHGGSLRSGKRSMSRVPKAANSSEETPRYITRSVARSLQANSLLNNPSSGMTD